MDDDAPTSQTEGLAARHASDSATIAEVYDDWARKYEADVESWGYEAPRVAVGLLAEHASTSAQVLDAGCGTGLVGAALAEAGFGDVVGVDLSSSSLDLAATTSNYRALTEIDFTDLPTSLPDAHFGALICVGVLTYLPEVEAVCREFCRVVEPDGILVLTQRTDLFDSRSTQAAFDSLAEDGTWTILDVSAPGAYLPGHPEYREIDVRYGTFRRNA